MNGKAAARGGEDRGNHASPRIGARRGIQPIPRLGALALLVAVAGLLSGFAPWRSPGAGTSSLGVADATVASGAGTAALYANPAGMAQVRQQTVEAGFGRSPQAGASGLYVASVDATSSTGLAAGVGYTRLVDWTFDAPMRTGSELRLGAGAGLSSDAGRLMFGVGARKLDLELREPGGGRRPLQGWTGDLGATVALQSVRLGVVWRNGVRTGDLDRDATEAPRRIATGVAFVSERVLVEADGAWSVSDEPGPGPSYRAGLAWQVSDQGLQLRGGYALDQKLAAGPDRHQVAFGLGFHTTSLGVEAATSLDVRDPSVFQLSVSLTLLVPYHAN